MIALAQDNQQSESELYLKTEQLLHFRLAFALASLIVSLLVGYCARSEFDLSGAVILTFAIASYSLIGLDAVRGGRIKTDTALTRFNGILIGADIVSLSILVHLTHGIDSDLYFLYLLPVLLSSHTFRRKGIYLTATAVWLSYVSTLIVENLEFVPYLLAPSHGLTAAYSQRIYLRIFYRSAILICVSYIWAAFCDYMSQVGEHSANTLREQLATNYQLIGEARAAAAREHLINTISSAIRSTLDLDQILKTTVEQLGAALSASRCAIFCRRQSTDPRPAIWEALHEYQPVKLPEFSSAFCQFILDNKAHYEQDVDGVPVTTTFVFDEPIREWSFRRIRDDLAQLSFRSLIVQPIMYGGRSKGVLLIASCDSRRHWTAPDLELVLSVAGQVAIAIEHSRLVDQLSNRNEDLLRKNLQLDSKNLELRSTQAQLIHQEKMASLGRMVAGIAHELNNPVNFVHGNLPYLRTYCSELKQIVSACDKLPDNLRAPVDELKKELKYDFLVTDLDHILADLEEGSQRIRQIIRNLRSFSRLDEAELKEASVKEGLESSVRILNQYYGRDKIPIILNCGDIPPITCYPGQLNQVWVNLLSNAAQALNGLEHGQVTVEVSSADGWVEVAVSDNGPGIKIAEQSKIFEPFFTTKPVGQGTGLGLSICHSIIEKHGGQICLESQPGQGTTFKVKIPVVARAQQLPIHTDCEQG